MSSTICNRRLVFFIDDSVGLMPTWVSSIQANDSFDVVTAKGPDDAIAFAQTSGWDVALVILDIMMPPGRAYRDRNTSQGMKTGVVLFRDLARLCPFAQYLVLTNMPLRDISHDFSGLPVTLVNKSEVESPGSPKDLRCRVEELLDPSNRLASMQHTLQVFRELQLHWDGRDASVIDGEIIDTAEEVVYGLLQVSLANPQLVPTPAGGVQCEYHFNNNSLEINFFTPTRVRAHCNIATETQNIDGELTSDVIDLLMTLLKRMGEPNGS